jgi:hypothetical protein
MSERSSADGPAESQGSAPQPQESFGDAPQDGTGTFGTAPGGQGSFGSAPSSSTNKVPLLVGGGIAIVIALAAIFGFLIR